MFMIRAIPFVTSIKSNKPFSTSYHLYSSEPQLISITPGPSTIGAVTTHDPA